ncbi:hypothetical protein LTR29_005908 [Friedmanniomyces endolithicus]|nr:hypothetical protein LTR29_005908 [Friedmanniomyces endolithicus]
MPSTRRPPSRVVDLDKPRRSASQTSPWFTLHYTLPQELRDMIYEYLLPQTIDDVLVQAADHGRSTNHVVSTKPRISLIQVCKRLRGDVSDTITKRSLKEATRICYDAHDFNFYALESYLTLVAPKRAGGLASLKVLRVDPSITNKLNVHITVSKRWCRNTDLTSLNSWSKFVRDKAKLAEDEQLADYHFSEIEDKEVAVAAMGGFASGATPEKEKLSIGRAFYRWHMFRGDKNREKWFAEEVRQHDMIQSGEMESVIRPMTDAEEDAEGPVWCPEYNDMPLDDDDDDEEQYRSNRGLAAIKDGFKSGVLLDLLAIRRIIAERDELDRTKGPARWLGETAGVKG